MAGSHEAIGWLRPESDFTLEAAAARLIEQLPKATVKRHERSVSVSFRRWEIWLHLVGLSHVAEEAREYVGWYPDDPRAARVADCVRRVEVECPGEDQRGTRRKHFLAVCAVLAQFNGVLLRDPIEGEWLE
ncbi:MAG: hypothetical protein K2W96_13425 [Gemmataceae bacterium]|nr:hypothetical protein [Gemmataceae bacterium]